MFVKYFFVLSIICCWTLVGVGQPTDYGSQTESVYRDQPSFKRFDATSVYFHVSQTDGVNTTLFTTQGLYFPRVDIFSRLEALNTSELVNQTNIFGWIELVFNGTVSIKSAVKQFTNSSYFVPSFAAKVVMEEGIPTAIVWDSADKPCFGCDQTCVDGSCALSTSEYDCSGSGCNIKSFLAWNGTDSRKIELNSAVYLPSNYQIFSSRPDLEANAGVVQDFVYGLLNKFN